MISNFKKQINKKSDGKFIVIGIIAFLLAVWLCTPPGNKFLQICFWGNNTQYMIAKMSGKTDNNYLYLRNNAIYLAKMFPDKKTGILEMDRAINSVPSYINENELNTLYKERAEIKLFLGDKKGALSDFIKSKNIGFLDNLKVAMLFKDSGNYREAAKYCNNIIQTDISAYSGYACMADIYKSIGRPDISLRLWNVALERVSNKSKVYYERALIYKAMGDLPSYQNDIASSQKYNQIIDEKNSILEEAIHPKTLNLSIRKI